MYVGALQPASNRATYRESFRVTDENDEVVDLSDATIVYSIRDKESKSVILTATVGSGVDLTNGDDGVFEVLFTVAQMSRLCAKDYEVGCTIQADDDEDVEQFIIGTMSILDGIVR